MDLETENRIAAILMKEAAELRRQAEKEGVNAYLRQPNVRGRPNSRFLTATVLGVQQANRVVEVNEMWRARQKELELDNRFNGARTAESRSVERHSESDSGRNARKRLDHGERESSSSCSSSKRVREDGALRDDDVEEFLHSRVKRGRGAVGSRMDETGPYLPDSKGKQLTGLDEWFRDKCEDRVVLGPEKPFKSKSYASSEEESSGDRSKKAKKSGSSKHHSRKHSSKVKSKDKKKKRRKEEKKTKHH